jgi:hypothetical protein
LSALSVIIGIKIENAISDFYGIFIVFILKSFEESARAAFSKDTFA